MNMKELVTLTYEPEILKETEKAYLFSIPTDKVNSDSSTYFRRVWIPKSLVTFRKPIASEEMWLGDHEVACVPLWFSIQHKL